MAYQIAKEFPHDILFEQQGPFVSLYLPTTRYAAEKKKDLIVYKNLLKTVEASLARRYSAKHISVIMEQLTQLEEDKKLWENTLSGMAVLCSPATCVVYLLHDTVSTLAITADSFHTKPLIQAFQALDQYQLLGLNSREFDLFQGNRNGIDQLALPPGTPRTITEVLGDQLSHAEQMHVSANNAGQGSTFHGYGGGKPEIDKDTEKFFRFVDRFVSDNYSKASKLPLILVALPEHHPTFAKLSNNPYLLRDGITGDYTAFTVAQLKEQTRKILEAFHHTKVQNITERFEQAKAGKTGSDSLTVIGKAVVEGKVSLLLIDADKIIPGKVDPLSGKITDRSLDHPDTGDVLDTLAQLAMKSKCEVMVLPSADMPCDTGVAAIFRF